jgi:hypothetical protein
MGAVGTSGARAVSNTRGGYPGRLTVGTGTDIGFDGLRNRKSVRRKASESLSPGI